MVGSVLYIQHRGIDCPLATTMTNSTPFQAQAALHECEYVRRSLLIRTQEEEKQQNKDREDMMKSVKEEKKFEEVNDQLDLEDEDEEDFKIEDYINSFAPK